MLWNSYLTVVLFQSKFYLFTFCQSWNIWLKSLLPPPPPPRFAHFLCITLAPRPGPWWVPNESVCVSNTQLVSNWKLELTNKYLHEKIVTLILTLQRYLYDILTKASVVNKKISVLLLCNKTDKVTAHTKEFIRKQMEKEMYGFKIFYLCVFSWLHLLHIFLQAVDGIVLLLLPIW